MAEKLEPFKGPYRLCIGNSKHVESGEGYLVAECGSNRAAQWLCDRLNATRRDEFEKAFSIIDNRWTPEGLAKMRRGDEYCDAPTLTVGWKLYQAALATSSTPGQEAAPPFAYAYRYPGCSGDVIRFSHGEEINGSKPIEAIPLYTASALRSQSPTECPGEPHNGRHNPNRNDTGEVFCNKCHQRLRELEGVAVSQAPAADWMREAAEEIAATWYTGLKLAVAQEHIASLIAKHSPQPAAEVERVTAEKCAKECEARAQKAENKADIAPTNGEAHEWHVQARALRTAAAAIRSLAPLDPEK